MQGDSDSELDTVAERTSKRAQSPSQVKVKIGMVAKSMRQSTLTETGTLSHKISPELQEPAPLET
jgi:hypothetical protein